MDKEGWRVAPGWFESGDSTNHIGAPYLLIEFQSTVDAWMAVRVMTYVGLLYQDLIRQKQVLPKVRDLETVQNPSLE